jgi:D-sedoheptulose 7-phosphate isomerase
MKTRSATSYFRHVSELMASIQATAADGSALSLDEATEDVVRRLIDTGKAAGKVVLIGNGGSASIAGHMEMDLCNRARIRASVFNDPPVLTALANDLGYDRAFERMVALWVEPGDCLVAISSSGASQNILRGVHEARRNQCHVVTLSGFKPDNPLRSLGDVNFYVASDEYGEVEVAHHALGHFLTDKAAEIAAAR